MMYGRFRRTLPMEPAESIKNIPMPDEDDTGKDKTGKDEARIIPPAKKPSLIDKFFKNLHFDDLLIIGLIILLLDDRSEDDFLIIILFYLLIT